MRQLALQFVAQLAEALDSMHERGIVHGFLRPETLLVVDKSQIVIPDWFLRWETAPPETLAASLPQVAPEYLRGEALVPASDQFLLACIAYRLLYGVRPFDAGSPSEQLLRISYGIWAGTSHLEQDIAVSDVWDRAFSAQSEWRFPSCTAFITALRGAIAAGEAADEQTSEAPGDKLLQRRNNRWVWPAAIAFAVLSLVFGVWGSLLQHTAARQAQQLSEVNGANSSGTLNNGIFSVCNPSATPLQILFIATQYRGSDTMHSFDSSNHPSAKWMIAPASRQSLSYAEDNKVLWDGSVLYYYLSYQSGGNLYVSTGIWDKPDGQCLTLSSS